MYCGSNKTALCSQRQIARAMMELLEDKPYDQISVCELCRAAGVSRQTFYSLFSSRENVIIFLMKDRYCFETGDCCCGGGEKDEEEENKLSVRELCRVCAEYMLTHRDFIRILTVNHIDHLLYDSIFEALDEYAPFLPGADPCDRRYAAGFYAGGVSSVSRCYANEGCSCSQKDLEDMLYTFFTGALF